MSREKTLCLASSDVAVTDNHVNAVIVFPDVPTQGSTKNNKIALVFCCCLMSAHKIEIQESKIPTEYPLTLSIPMLTTDYLVIGAGAASLSFVDTLLTELPDAKITIVDKHDAPGGHWNDAYGYVHLHQPSLLYGVASHQLEGNWLKLVSTKFTLPWNHRASKTELLKHYKTLLEQWIAQGSVKYYPKCLYDFEKKPPPTSNVHTFYALDGSMTCNIKVQQKLVNGTLGECRVPSKCPPTFPIDDGVQLMTPNELYDMNHSTKKKSKFRVLPFGSSVTTPDNKYVVMGCGKTAMDAVVYLQRSMGVHPDSITWIIPNDVWMLRREGPGSPSSWPEALLKSDLDPIKAGLLLEKEGTFARLDKKVMPTKYRLPVVGKEELQYLRNVTNIIRQGRITSISNNEADKSVEVSFQEGDLIQFSQNHVFVHCTSPGPFNGNKQAELFPSDKEMNLWLLFAPPIPISMSCLAVLEGRRRKGLLDLDFGRKLLPSSKEKLSDNEILNSLVTGYKFTDDMTADPAGQVDVLTVIARFLCLFDKDPMAGYKWKSSNRLSMYSIPDQKCHMYETVKLMLSKKDILKLSEEDVKALTLMEEKLKPLEGM